MTKPLIHFSDFRDLNIKLIITKDNTTKDIFLPWESSVEDLQRRFLQIFNRDPSLYSFYSNGAKLQPSQTLYTINPNPVSDYIIECHLHESLERKHVPLKIDEQASKFTIRYKNKFTKKDIIRIFAIFFNLPQNQITVEQDNTNGYFFMTQPQLQMIPASIGKSKHYFPVTTSTTILDVLFLANYRYGLPCNEFTYNNNLYFCNDLLPPIHGRYKIFLKNKPRSIIFRDRSQDYTLHLDGSPIGRNVQRAIAQLLKISYDEIRTYKVYSRSDYTKTALPFFKLLTNDTLSNPIKITKKTKIEVQIRRPDGTKAIKEYYTDLKSTLFKLRQQIRNTENAASPCFVHFMNSKNIPLTDYQLTIGKAIKNNHLHVRIDPPAPIDVTFQLYENKTLQIPIDPKDTVVDVQHKVAEAFHIDFRHIHLWVSYYKFKNNHPLLTYLQSPDTIINIADLLKVTISYHSHESTRDFPLNLVFDDLSLFCSRILQLSNNFGLFVANPEDKEKKIPVYCSWIQHPYYEFVSMIRDQETHATIYILDGPSTPPPEQEHPEYQGTSAPVQCKLEVHTEDGCMVSTKEFLTNQDLASVIESENLPLDSLFFVQNKNYPETTFIGDLPLTANNNIISIFPPEAYVYHSPTIKSESKMKFVNPTAEMTVMEFRDHVSAQVNKEAVFINIFSNDFQVTNLWQPIKLFDQRNPFRVEIVDQVTYKMNIHIKDEICKENVPILAKSKCFDLKKHCLDFINKKIPKTAKKKDITMQEIRVTIDSIILSKDLDMENLIRTFGIKATGEVILLEKFYFSFRDNLNGFNLSPNDTIRYAKKNYITNMLHSSAFDNYKVLFNNFMVNEDYPLSHYTNDDDCYDIKGNEDLRAVQLILPEIVVNNLIFSNDLIAYDMIDYIARNYYNTDPANIQLKDRENDTIIDDNDLFDNIFYVQVVFPNGQDLRLSEEVLQRIQEENNQLQGTPNNDVEDGFFLCPFTEADTKINFELKLDTNTTYDTAKLHVSKYLSSTKDEAYEPENIMISINNNEIQSTLPLHQILTALQQNNENSRFPVSIIETNDDLFSTLAGGKQLGVSQLFNFTQLTKS